MKIKRNAHLAALWTILVGLSFAVPSPAKILGRADERGLVRVFMGTVGFRQGETRLEMCVQAAVLDYAANSLVFDHRCKYIVLTALPNHTESTSLAKRRLLVAQKYLTEAKGIDPGRLILATDSSKTARPTTDYEPCVRVDVVLRAASPGALLEIDDAAGTTIGYP